MKADIDSERVLSDRVLPHIRNFLVSIGGPTKIRLGLSVPSGLHPLIRIDMLISVQRCFEGIHHQQIDQD